MNIFDVYEQKLRAAIGELVSRKALPEGLDLSRIVVEPPRDPTHGDLSTNAAMVLAKAAKASPDGLARELMFALNRGNKNAEVETKGPGFVNWRLKPSEYHPVLRAAVTDPDFGRSQIGRGEKVNVEYVSANPTGPMHVGHGRGAVFGDALADLLAFTGHAVTREYYINDAGAQVDILARSAYLRYREALGEDVGTIPEGLYPGDYLKPVGEALAKKHGRALLGQREAEWLPEVRDTAIAMMMTLIREDLAALNVKHDVFFSERSLQANNGGQVAALIEDLRRRGLVYEGRLPPPKGKEQEDWEDREQTLFKATAFGDDVDRPLLKSDGSFTYFASDIAYHRSKFERGFKEMIDVWGADHGGYVKRVQASLKAVTGGEGHLDVKLCQLVRLFRDGVAVRMSKRSGDLVTLRDVIDEVGRDPIRFMMVFRKNDAALDFDLAKVLEQSKDNPVFYVQYAHARCCSAFRQAAEAFPRLSLEPRALGAADFGALSDEGELAVIRSLAQYPRVIEAAAASHEPHRIAFFLYDLASLFHSLWNKGKDVPALRFVNQGNPDLTSARLALVYAVRSVIASGLAILGVTAPEEMR
jgi:arginyl-tRNA synthetase